MAAQVKRSTKMGAILVVVWLLILLLLVFVYPESNRLLDPHRHNPTFLFAQEELIKGDAIKPSSSSVTVISVYIELNKSKHSVQEYDNWIRNMAKSVTSPLAIVVNKNAYSKLKKLRQGRSTKFYIVEDIWSIMTQVEIERQLPYIASYLLKQNSIDPEQAIHNPNFYALWNLKSYIAHRISQENPFGSQFFIYTDAGAFRERTLDVWPDVYFVNTFLLDRLANRVLLGQIADSDHSNPHRDGIEGTFFAGSQSALQEFYQNFYSIHDSRFKKGIFIGKDQTTMNLLAFRMFPETTVRLKAWGLSCPFSFDIWFYYQLYFSPNSSIQCVQNRDSILLEPYVRKV